MAQARATSVSSLNAPHEPHYHLSVIVSNMVKAVWVCIINKHLQLNRPRIIIINVIVAIIAGVDYLYYC